ncbi:hypothetical protein [Phenylobacterium sp.]|uniref:hypothetical protein n=1 Tax=Phenylobacterium sp. TaxID=1871053 RepID=UPI002CAB0C24|nr:hypothetical protein [Phenylobacterium sp.]HLZ75520.1 hypothetical protein [Phenylobacterium sp.]
MGRAYDPGRAMRERLKLLEAREKGRAEARAVADGVAETVALARARGAKFEKPAPGRGTRETPYRRQAGLDWLARKGRISAAQQAAGERYGACWRRAGAAPTIGSTLEVQPSRGLAGGPPLNLLLKQALGREQAVAELAGMRARLFGQSDLVSVCDLICGQELTPREAGGGEREAGRVEAVLKVALDLLCLPARRD